MCQFEMWHIPHRLMCSNNWLPVGWTVWERCRTFGPGGITGGSGSLWVGHFPRSAEMYHTSMQAPATTAGAPATDTSTLQQTTSKLRVRRDFSSPRVASVQYFATVRRKVHKTSVFFLKLLWHLVLIVWHNLESCGKRGLRKTCLDQALCIPVGNCLYSLDWWRMTQPTVNDVILWVWVLDCRRWGKQGEHFACFPSLLCSGLWLWCC